MAPDRYVSHVLKRLPPFEWLPRQELSPRRLTRLHLSIVTVLYLTFVLLSFATDVLWPERGIGVTDNPPFFGHFLITSLSIPLVCAVVIRACRSIQPVTAQGGARAFLILLRKSHLKYVIYFTSALIGLAALALAFVMALSFTEDIYDSARLHPWTFGFYSLIRTYQYTLCYPALISVPITTAVLLFRSIEISSVRYEPFAPDELGGLRIYIRAVDRPIYLIQLLLTVIAVANYIGWGTMSRVPMILTIGSVVVITLMGAVLQVSFSQTVKRLRSKEVAHIREWQARLYASVITSGEPSSGTKSIVEDIEAGDRLVEIIHKRRNYAWAKYAFNLLFAIAPPLIRSVMIPR